MTIEEFNALSIEVKKNLMIHWWHYYGKRIYTFEELQQFISLLNNDIDKVIEIAIVNYMYNQGPTPLLMVIRKNEVGKLLEALPNISELPQDALDNYYQIKTAFINEIVNTSGLDLSGGRK